jgi:hypothetical protein
MSDSAVLANGRVPTGTLTFNLYGRATSAASTPLVPLTTAADGNATYGSGNVTAAIPGTYQWTVSYGGDANNNPAPVTACGSEQVTVTKASPSLSTTPSASVPVGAVQSQSTSTCTAEAGSTTIAYLSVGNVVVIVKSTVIAPNTKICVLGVALILDEQIAGPGTLTVNAVHVEINALGLN